MNYNHPFDFFYFTLFESTTIKELNDLQFASRVDFINVLKCIMSCFDIIKVAV